jgi:hypothetical protein
MYGLSLLRKGKPDPDDEDEKEKNLWYAMMNAGGELMDTFLFPGVGNLARPVGGVIQSIAKKLRDGEDIATSTELNRLLRSLSDNVGDNLATRFLDKVGRGIKDVTAGWTDDDWGRFWKGASNLIDAGGMATGLPTGGPTQITQTALGAAGYPLEEGGWDKTTADRPYVPMQGMRRAMPRPIAARPAAIRPPIRRAIPRPIAK